MSLDVSSLEVLSDPIPPSMGYLSRKTSNTIFVGKILNKNLELDYVVVYTTIPFNYILNYFKILILNLYMIIYINNNFILQIGNRL